MFVHRTLFPSPIQIEQMNVAVSENEDCNMSRKSSKRSRCQNQTICLPCIHVRNLVDRFGNVYKHCITLFLKYTFFILFLVYVGFALDYKFGDEQSVRLLVCTLVVVFVVVWRHCHHSSCVRIGIRSVFKCCVQPLRRFYYNNSAVVDT